MSFPIFDQFIIFWLIRLIEMELRLNEDEESRPESLTPNFLSLLMAAENKKKGIFQLLSFKNKK